ncbi:MAG: hypothetical protein Q4F67_07315 [Propionibacteriaceae bacterium]|nr:hypothetical protein [Propionibacteriaceae bacterium]
MDYHYDALQAVFDGWIVVLMVALTVIAVLRLRGIRRALVAGGFGICALATVLWLPMVGAVVLAPLFHVVGPDVVWHIPTFPWLIGIALVAIGIFWPVASAPPSAQPAFPPPSAHPDFAPRGETP